MIDSELGSKGDEVEVMMKGREAVRRVSRGIHFEIQIKKFGLCIIIKQVEGFTQEMNFIKVTFSNEKPRKVQIQIMDAKVTTLNRGLKKTNKSPKSTT